MELCLVTSNEGKLREVRSILRRDVSSISLELPEIQAVRVSDVVEDKAKRAYNEIHKPVIVEDTGLYVTAWGGFPGALIKWMLNSIGNDGLCKLVKADRDNSAYAETIACFYDGKTSLIFNGRLDGAITDVPRGSGGFGWDPIFQPRGHNRTLAEMDNEEKNAISMRKEAFLKLKTYLDNNY